MLRYNPVLQRLVVLRDELLGPVQRFAFENDASDEHLPPDHWFWDEERSGGVFVEHGVHFFDAAHLLLGSRPEHLVAVTAARPDGRTDLVSATARHPGGRSPPTRTASPIPTGASASGCASTTARPRSWSTAGSRCGPGSTAGPTTTAPPSPAGCRTVRPS